MAALSKTVCRMGTFRLVEGKNPATVAQQQAGITTMVFFPRA
jgi:hypothetical protein